MSFHTFLSYSELTQSKPTEKELDELISSFKREPTVRLLAMINNFLAIFPISFDKSKFTFIQRFLAKNLLNEELNKKLSAFGTVSIIDRPLFHRQQVLYLMKKVLLNGSDSDGIDPNDDKEARYKLGKALLMISDFFLTFEQEERIQVENPSGEEESEKMLNELLAQMLPIIELMNPPLIDSAIARTQEFIEISSSEYPEEFGGKTLSTLFESLNGLSIERFLQMVIGIYAWFLIQDLDDLIGNPANFNLRKSTLFSNLDYTQEEIDSFFRLTSINFEQLIIELKNNPLSESLKEQYDYTVFRKYPTLYLDDDIFTLIDFSFLIEKCSLGLYHTILNSLPQDKKIREKFFQHWGYVFEKQVISIFREVYSSVFSNFHPNTYFDTKDNNEAFDGIIEYPTSLLVMEFKGGLLNTRAKYSGVSEPLLQEMNEKFGTSKRKSGIKQLAVKIEHLFNANYGSRLQIRGLKFQNIRLVYPMLIVNEISMEFGLANWRLKTWFQKEIESKNIDSSISVQPLMVLTIEDLEMITPYLKAGDFTLLEFADYYSKLEYIRFAHFSIREHWFEPMTSLAEAFIKFRDSKGIKPRLNEKNQAKWDSFNDKIMQLFK